MDNVNFERDPKNLFEKVERRTNHIAHILKIKTFVKNIGKFWRNIWEKDYRTLEMPWVGGKSKRALKKTSLV